MELTALSWELAGKAVKEAVQEAGKTAEAAVEFGKVGREASAEPIRMGRLGTGEGSRQIHFGSLANGAFRNSENYRNWKDGIDPGELEEGWLEELTNEIAAIYGKDNIRVNEYYGLNNVGIESTLGELLYDPQYLQEAGNRYGTDTVLGTLAHEVGHRVVHNIGLKAEITPYENEACADYIAGLTSRLCKLDSTQRLSWYNQCPEFSRDGIHPGRAVRSETFLRGLARIDVGKEAALLRTFEDFSPYDLEGVYQDANLMKQILYQDVIVPLRTGEIQKV